MGNKHDEIQKTILNRYKDKYGVEPKAVRKKVSLPDKERHWYEPDIILRDNKGEIKYIIEIENDPMRKALVGAIILADRSVRELRQKRKPKLIFVVYAKEGIKQIDNFKVRLKLAKEYVKYLKDVKIYTKRDFYKSGPR